MYKIIKRSELLKSHLIDLDNKNIQTPKGQQLQHIIKSLTSFSLESKNNNNILWGRIQGTQEEEKALLFIQKELSFYNFDYIKYEKFPCFQKQWKPTKCAILAKSLNHEYTFHTAITAFESATTPQEGLTAKCVFVGTGTKLELEGKNLNNKFVLLKADCYPNALLNSARRAFLRIAETTKALGVIIYWQNPINTPIAGRVGTPMGGDAKGGVLPWISISRDEGIQLRQLLENDPNLDITLNIQGEMEERKSGHVLAFIKGKSEKTILLTMHVDGYFYAIHDNGAGVAIGMELAKYFSQKNQTELPYSLLFHFSGDHEVPGAGGTRIIGNNQELMKNILVAYQIEHIFSPILVEESGILWLSNAQNPQSIFVSHGHNGLKELLLSAALKFNIPYLNSISKDPTGDIQGLYPPFAPNKKLLSAGFIEGSVYYHSQADGELNFITDTALENTYNLYQYILEESLKKQQDFYDNDKDFEDHLFTSQFIKNIYNTF